jgi:hypothetical protein
MSTYFRLSELGLARVYPGWENGASVQVFGLPQREKKMRPKKKYMKSGKHSPLRGVRVTRSKRFRAVLNTKSGVKVRSKYERVCADYLSKEGIRFQYEPLMLLGARQVRPDFYLPDFNLFLEICGYDHMPYYRSRTARKRRLYRELGLRSAFIHYDGKGSLEELIHKELERWSES